MKKTLLFAILLILNGNLVIGQTDVPKNGIKLDRSQLKYMKPEELKSIYYITDTALNKFVGKWQSESVDNKLLVKLNKVQKESYNKTRTYDALSGEFLYLVKGTEVLNIANSQRLHAFTKGKSNQVDFIFISRAEGLAFIEIRLVMIDHNTIRLTRPNSRLTVPDLPLPFDIELKRLKD